MVAERGGTSDTETTHDVARAEARVAHRLGYDVRSAAIEDTLMREPEAVGATGRR